MYRISQMNKRNETGMVFGPTIMPDSFAGRKENYIFTSAFINSGW